MTREEFNELDSEKLSSLIKKLLLGEDLKNQIQDMENKLEELNSELDSLDININEKLKIYNSDQDLKTRITALEEAQELKNDFLGNQIRIADLEAKKAEIEEEYYSMFKNELESNKKRTVFKNKLIINKNDGIKKPKKESKVEKNKISLSERYSKVVTKVKNAASVVKEKSDDAKEYIKEGTRKVAFTINRKKCAIAKTTKGAINGIKTAFSNAAIYVGDKKKIVVAKSKRFINITKARIDAKVAQINELEDLKRRLNQERKIGIQRAAENYEKAVTQAKSL